MTATRRLAAILAADVAGYSRLMGRTRKARSNASKRCAASFSIRKSLSTIAAVVKTTGDGTLVEFAGVIDAMRCPAEVQRGPVWFSAIPARPSPGIPVIPDQSESS
jgi:adenylate cyclase